ncbi:hypothetical protein D3C78_1241730 [compost metagenome]
MLDTACKIPNSISARNRLRRCIKTPPNSAPTMVANRPRVLFTRPTSPASKPTPRIRKVVLKLPAKASPILYITISNRISHALLRAKKSRSGATTAISRVRGAGMLSSGSGAISVAATPISISPAINQ